MFANLGNMKRPSASDFAPFEKNFYTEHESTKATSNGIVEEFRQKHQIRVESLSVHPESIPKPVFSFEHAGFPSPVMKVIRQAGFKEPTPIQSQAWPIALSGHDLVGIAETGTGKTLAFGLPAITHIQAQPPLRPGDGPVGLVLVPTRELATQTNAQMERFTSTCNLTSVCVYGGASKMVQLRQINQGAEIVIATPGRLLEFLSSGVLSMSRVTYLVLDEADRMLDMGFEPQIRAVLQFIRPDRQTLMFSATWPREIQQLARDFLNAPTKINVGSSAFGAANPRVKQHFHFIHEHDKLQKLHMILEEARSQSGKVLIFAATKRTVDEMTNKLTHNGWPVVALHGDKSQAERDWAIREFREGTIPILISTDVASRGLDIRDITHIVNYDMTTDRTSYVHRIGRTARAGAHGNAHSFFTPNNAGVTPAIVAVLEEIGHEVPPTLRRWATDAKTGRLPYVDGDRRVDPSQLSKSWTAR